MDENEFFNQTPQDQTPAPEPLQQPVPPTPQGVPVWEGPVPQPPQAPYQPPYDRPVYPRPPYEQQPPQYGQPQFGQPQYNQPPFGQPLQQPAPNPETPCEPDAGKGHKSAILVFCCLLFVGFLAFAILAIVLDVRKGTRSGDYVAGEIVNVEIGVQTKPAVDEEYRDENGKYTPEGIAIAVRPSIVDIYTYSDSEQDSELKQIGSGSGIILSADGYVLTNAHVLESANHYTVHLSDDTTYEADLIGRDTKTDIAVLKVEAKDLTAATLGDSDEVIIGEEVIAIGNPAGLSGTITNGIVSAVNRKIKTDSTGFEMNCIQTNAAISPGNSGGALINMYGQVIGITSSKYVINSSYEGLGFAITINEAIPIIEDLISQGYVSGRFRIGIQFYEATSMYAGVVFEQERGFAMPEGMQGLMIDTISEECSIADTALVPYDFLTTVNGKAVSNYDTLYAVIADYQEGEILTGECVHVADDGSTSTYTIEFTLMKDTSGDF